MVVFHVIAALSGVVFLAGVAMRARLWLRGRAPGVESDDRRANAVALARRAPSALNRRRLRATLLDGLLLRRMWRNSRSRWAIHFSIAWSFVGLFMIGSLGNFVADLGVPLEKDDAWFAVTNDALGLTLLAGVSLAAFRRFVVRERSTKTRFDDAAVLAALLVLAAGGFLVEAGRYLDEGTPGSTAAYAFLGYPLSQVLKPLGLHWGAAYDAIWWTHSLVALGLVAYMPYSKLFHVFTAPATVNVRAGIGSPVAGGVGLLAPAAGVEAARWSPFSALQLLEMDACTRCGECLRACSSFAVTGDELAAPMGMIRMRRELFGLGDVLQPRVMRREDDSASEWKRYQDGVFSCTLCARCEEFCPVGIKTKDLALTMRQELATARCMMPANLEIARQAVLDEHNVFNFPNEDRAMWAEFLDDLPPDILDKEHAEVLYYVGCVSSFSPAVQEIPQAFLRVLLKAGVDVALLGGKEWCCGFPLIVGGRAVDAEKLIEHNMAEVRRLGAKTIVFNCPSCYFAWTKWYPLEGVRLVHSTEFIRDLVASGRLTFEDGDIAVTYHDPCDLGRGMGVYDAPREVLKAFAGGDYIELTPSREQALCCGGGGDIEMWDPDLMSQVNGMLTDSIERSGAHLVVQACPQCKRATQRGLDGKSSSVRTMDITEVALEFGTFTSPDAAQTEPQEESRV